MQGTCFTLLMHANFVSNFLNMFFTFCDISNRRTHIPMFTIFHSPSQTLNQSHRPRSTAAAPPAPEAWCCHGLSPPFYCAASPSLATSKSSNSESATKHSPSHPAAARGTSSPSHSFFSSKVEMWKGRFF